MVLYGLTTKVLSGLLSFWRIRKITYFLDFFSFLRMPSLLAHGRITVTSASVIILQALPLLLLSQRLF